MSARKPAELRLGHRTKAEKAAQVARDTVAASTPTLDEMAKASPIGDAPDYLDATAKTAWNLAAPALKAVQLLSAPDRVAFGRYAQWLASWFELAKHPVRTLAKRSRGAKVERIDRGFQARLALDKRLMDYEDRFGMNPESRQAIFARLAAAPGLKPPANDKPKSSTSPIGFLNTGAKPPTRLQ